MHPTDSIEIAIVTGIVAVHWVLPAGAPRRAWLVFSGLAIAAAWDPKLPLVLALAVGFSHAVGRMLPRLAPVRRRIVVTLASAACLVAPLALKLLGGRGPDAPLFFRSSGAPDPRHLVIPVGLAFLGLQVSSYLIDVARGRTAPARLFDLAVLNTFFPRLVAGPVVRVGAFVEQLRARPAFAEVDARRAGHLLLLGFAKRVCVAGSLGIYVDAFWKEPLLYDATGAWIAGFAAVGWLYAEVSGYADLACGTALFLGYEIPRGFGRPLGAPGPLAFAARWNLGLTRWFHDAVARPFAARDRWIAAAASGAAALLFALWHRPTVSFALVGVLLAVPLALQTALQGTHRAPGSRIRRTLAGAATLVWIVPAALLVVRSTGGLPLMNALEALAGRGSGERCLPLGLLGALAVLLVLHRSDLGARTLRAARRLPAPVVTVLYGVVFAVLVLLSVMPVREALYSAY